MSLHAGAVFAMKQSVIAPEEESAAPCRLRAFEPLPEDTSLARLSRAAFLLKQIPRIAQPDESFFTRHIIRRCRRASISGCRIIAKLAAERHCA